MTKINDRCYLRIKLKHLAAETRIIRNEELKLKRRVKKLTERLLVKGKGNADVIKALDARRESMHDHRIKVVRRVARETHIAYGYLSGLSFEQIEPNSDRQINWTNVEKMVHKYGNADDRNMFGFWKSKAIHDPRLAA